MLALLALLAPLALADTITLDTGAAIEGELAWYDYEGDCQIAVTGGGLTGSIVVVPCTRIVRFERDPADFAPSVLSAVEEVPLDEPAIGAPLPEALAVAVEPDPAPAVEDLPAALPAEEAPAEVLPVDIEGVPLDEHVLVDPALQGDAGDDVAAGPADGRVPSPSRAPTVREPVPDRSATLMW